MMNQVVLNNIDYSAVLYSQGLYSGLKEEAVRNGIDYIADFYYLHSRVQL